ncbi:uncharacterized protein TRIVIDRAFT_33132 [Trichoderma virens Gv29-8]|uniref:Cupin type-1 domain-containing protein n=1 Tax=Hypocrea virens (strain Gv29-8 / FGSC 10586) TaxID=413071 RepID=G9MJB1_HYPVG|nr:uncharacterized protein TRIVIDRAFT_33132 [Trichoderma virens Gv29-8]EHK25574.1 hypothetical protein TRIVIDRAFT_33132 [Trichoderma virens Gv29-8]UKZ48605.1 hypothetical protein TrVGV298_002831 [Trichoderma virens]UKZ75143.1 hypothetical protein TrVFT333_002816 [Trichoderma virens FT-333]
MADKIPTLIESGLLNGGKRSVVDSELGPGSTTFPHFHTLFTENFKLLSGDMTVIMAPEGVKDAAAMKEIPMKIGEDNTVPRFTAHTFRAGEEGSRVMVTFEPAAIGFERVILIMRGLQDDAEYKSWGSGTTEENAMLVSVLSELTDSHPLLASDSEMLDKQDKEAHEKFKSELISKYATDDMIKAAVAKAAASA